MRTGWLWVVVVALLNVACRQTPQSDAKVVTHEAKTDWAAEPRLLKSVGTYNIVAFHDRVYAVPQSLGEVDWRQDVASMKGVVVGGTEAEVLPQLHPSNWMEDPHLLRSVGSYNIVAFHDKIYAVPQSLGQVDWRGRDVAAMKGVITGQTEQEVVERLPKSQ
jgi:hypothetical protein